MDLVSTLDAYVPRDDREAADIDRVRRQRGDRWSRDNPLHVTGSALVVHPDTRRVLLRWHNRQQAWLQVGGHGDPGETRPFAVAMRESVEETGLDDLEPWPSATDPRPVQVVIVPVPASSSEAAHEHADIRYLLSTRNPDTAEPESDRNPLRWMAIADAIAEATRDNVAELLRRARDVLDVTESGHA